MEPHRPIPTLGRCDATVALARLRLIRSDSLCEAGTFKKRLQLYMGVSENVVYPFLPNGFADHYPY
jgi:hypothetical protein